MRFRQLITLYSCYKFYKSGRTALPRPHYAVFLRSFCSMAFALYVYFRRYFLWWRLSLDTKALEAAS